MWLQKTHWSEEGTQGTPEKQLFLFPDSLGVSGRTPAHSLLRTLVKHSQVRKVEESPVGYKAYERSNLKQILSTHLIYQHKEIWIAWFTHKVKCLSKV